MNLKTFQSALNNQKGVAPLLILIAAFFLLAFLLVSNTFSFRSSLFSAIFPKSNSLAANNNLELEKASISGSATVGNDTLASGGQYIQFGTLVQNPSPIPTVNPTSAPSSAPVGNCTKTLDLSQGSISGLVPGDVVCVKSGNRGAISITGANGQSGNPITFINSGGVVNVSGASGPGISIINSNYVRLTGNGSSNNCGSRYSPSSQQCGFNISATGKGILVNKDDSKDFAGIEIDHVRIHDLNASASFPAGIRVGNGNPSYGTGTDTYIHDNYIHDVAREAVYVGDPNDTSSQIMTLRGVDESYNLVERAGWSGMDTKGAIERVKIHHNIVRQPGTDGLAHQGMGFQITSGTTGEVYNNLIIDPALEGIVGHNTTANSKVYNNVVINPKSSGIKWDAGANIKIYNNTIVNGLAQGIEIGSSASSGCEIFDNIIASTQYVSTGCSSVTNNFTGSVSAAGFVNAPANDFHLTSSSQAKDAGRNSGLFPIFDFDDVSRPQGTKTDQGAFEYK